MCFYDYDGIYTAGVKWYLIDFGNGRSEIVLTQLGLVMIMLIRLVFLRIILIIELCFSYLELLMVMGLLSRGIRSGVI